MSFFSLVGRPTLVVTPRSNGNSITCVHCYIKGEASAAITVDGSFNASDIITNVTSQIGDEINSLINTTVDAIQDYASNLIDEALDFELGPEDFSFDNYTIDADFDFDMPPLPDCRLKFSFDGLELYVQLGVVVEGTFSIPIFRSHSHLGIHLGDHLRVGVVLTIDLILSADTHVELENGFHIKFHDGVALDIAMFSQQVSGVAL